MTTTDTKSERIIHALQQLPQFLPHQSSSKKYVVHVLTGARVSATPDPDDVGHEFISLKFNAGEEIEVNGPLYLKLQILEAAAHEIHADVESGGKLAKRANELYSQLCGKHDI